MTRLPLRLLPHSSIYPAPLLEKDCAVCKEQFTLHPEDHGELIIVTLPCNHPFHQDCIVPWLKSSGTCPVCRFVSRQSRCCHTFAYADVSGTSLWLNPSLPEEVLGRTRTDLHQTDHLRDRSPRIVLDEAVVVVVVVVRATSGRCLVVQVAVPAGAVVETAIHRSSNGVLWAIPAIRRISQTLDGWHRLRLNLFMMICALAHSQFST